MATTSLPPVHHHRAIHLPSAADPLHGLDETIDREIGADLRLLYGMLVPILVVCGMIFLLVSSPSYWLVAAAVAVELVALGLIVTKQMAMLDEPESEED